MELQIIGLYLNIISIYCYETIMVHGRATDVLIDYCLPECIENEIVWQCHN